MYEIIVYRETAPTVAGEPQVVLDWARQWQAADKVVYSGTLAEPRSARTRIERSFDPDAVRRLKAGAGRDLAVAGPNLAGQALRAGLVDEFHLIVCPVIVGGGTRFFPGGVRLDLELLEEHRFGSGVAALRRAPLIALHEVSAWHKQVQGDVLAALQDAPEAWFGCKI